MSMVVGGDGQYLEIRIYPLLQRATLNYNLPIYLYGSSALGAACR